MYLYNYVTSLKIKTTAGEHCKFWSESNASNYRLGTSSQVALYCQCTR